MSAFYFKTRDLQGDTAADEPFEFPDMIAAIEQAKKVLAEMALDGIPTAGNGGLMVEVENSNHQTIARIRLDTRIEFPDVHGR